MSTDYPALRSERRPGLRTGERACRVEDRVAVEEERTAFKIMDISKIEKEVEAGYINCQRHPTAPLRIFNYSARTQFEWRWNDETMSCRGLILDDENTIVARPFRKFFSYEQLNGNVPFGEFEVFEKMDGSLGVLYWDESGERCLATRGSFISEQAQVGTRILREKYGHVRLCPEHTYLFEIIYPKNRIVVNYGEREDIVLLAIIDTETGEEIPLADIGFPVVRQFDGIKDLGAISKMDEPNKEGFVARFRSSGTRVKFKFEEYKRLHRLVTGINPRHIWEALSKGDGLASLVEKVPDEFFSWVKAVQAGLRKQYTEIETVAKADFKNCGDRRVNAEYFKTCRYPSILFSILDGRDYAPQIWKMIRPVGGSAFRCDIDS